MPDDKEKMEKVARLIGWALFNLTKCNYMATEILLNQVYAILTDKSWDKAWLNLEE